jgi:menaquinol-cytochrome c reductase iron-sulfur subunit
MLQAATRRIPDFTHRSERSVRLPPRLERIHHAHMSDWEATPRDRPAEASAQADVPPSSMRRRFLSRLSVGLGGARRRHRRSAGGGIPPLTHAARRTGCVARGGCTGGFSAWFHRQGDLCGCRTTAMGGYANESAAWLRRDGEDEFVAFSAYCTHTGCPVRWVAGAEMFMCPCHGGSFWRDGSVAAGPPPRPLERLQVRIRDGQVEVSPIGVPQTDG